MVKDVHALSQGASSGKISTNIISNSQFATIYLITLMLYLLATWWLLVLANVARAGPLSQKLASDIVSSCPAGMGQRFLDHMQGDYGITLEERLINIHPKDYPAWSQCLPSVSQFCLHSRLSHHSHPLLHPLKVHGTDMHLIAMLQGCRVELSIHFSALDSDFTPLLRNQVQVVTLKSLAGGRIRDKELFELRQLLIAPSSASSSDMSLERLDLRGNIFESGRVFNSLTALLRDGRCRVGAVMLGNVRINNSKHSIV